MIYIGIDPGKKGGYAITDGQIISVFPWDDKAFVDNMAVAMNTGKCVAAVEKVGAMPGQGVTSMFSFGQSYGFILGVLAALGIPCQLVPPRKWKAEFGLLNTEKQDSVTVAKRLFPNVSLLPTDRCRKESDGMSDSLLLCEYARRKFLYDTKPMLQKRNRLPPPICGLQGRVRGVARMAGDPRARIGADTRVKKRASRIL